MNYISAAEAAQLWGCSRRWVVKLCISNQIPGAQMVGAQWLIPEDAERPSLTRSKALKAKEPHEVPYLFPYLLRPLSESEKQKKPDMENRMLYRCIMDFENGNYEESLLHSEKLLRECQSPYVRFGVLYNLIFTCLLLRQYEQVDRYIVRFEEAFNAAPAHHEELDFIRQEVTANFEGGECYANPLSVEADTEYSREFLAYFTAVCALIAVYQTTKDDSVPNPIPHEISCLALERDGYLVLAMLMHYYIAMMYLKKQNEKKVLYNMRRFLDFALEYDYLTTPSYLFSYFPGNVSVLLKEYPEEFVTKLKKLGMGFATARAEYLVHEGRTKLFARLDVDEVRLMSYCVRKLSLEQMAREENCSGSVVRRRLTSLYSKLGVKSKGELSTLYTKIMLDLTELPSAESEEKKE